MNLTFDVFRQKYKRHLETNTWWKLELDNENDYKIRNKLGKRWYFKKCDTITNTISAKLDNPCLIYQKEIKYNKTKEEKLFEAVGYVQGTLIVGEIIIEQNGEMCKPNTTWFNLDEDWYKTNKLPKTEALKEFEALVVEHILELPEYRLYDVTGMLKG